MQDVLASKLKKYIQYVSVHSGWNRVVEVRARFYARKLRKVLCVVRNWQRFVHIASRLEIGDFLCRCVRALFELAVWKQKYWPTVEWVSF